MSDEQEVISEENICTPTEIMTIIGGILGDKNAAVKLVESHLVVKVALNKQAGQSRKSLITLNEVLQKTANERDNSNAAVVEMNKQVKSLSVENSELVKDITERDDRISTLRDQRSQLRDDVKKYKEDVITETKFKNKAEDETKKCDSDLVKFRDLLISINVTLQGAGMKGIGKSSVLNIIRNIEELGLEDE